MACAGACLPNCLGQRKKNMRDLLEAKAFFSRLHSLTFLHISTLKLMQRVLLLYFIFILKPSHERKMKEFSSELQKFAFMATCFNDVGMA